MKNFTFALLLSLAGAASAQTSACADIQQAWASKYHTDFGVQWPLATFACGDAVGRFAEAIHALATTSFVPNESGFRPDFYGIVAAATRRTIYQATHPHYSYAAASASAGSLWLHDAYFQGTLEWRTATLVHETRHNQAGDPLHVICDRGDARGNMSCDATFHGGEMLGSGYNYDVHFYWWLRDSAQQTTLSRSVSGASIRHLVLNRFNTISNEHIQKFAP